MFSLVIIALQEVIVIFSCVFYTCLEKLTRLLADESENEDGKQRKVRAILLQMCFWLVE